MKSTYHMIGNSGRIDFSGVFSVLVIYKLFSLSYGLKFKEAETKMVNWCKREGGVLCDSSFE